MNVVELQALIRAATVFAQAAEISEKARGKLVNVADALESFKEMDIGAFAELIRHADVHRRTGEWPPTGPKPRTRTPRPSAVSADELARKVEQLTQQLNALYEVVHEESVGFGAIDEIVAAIGKLNKTEILRIAAGFGLKLKSSMTKPNAIEEIKRKLVEKKGSAQRVNPITAG